MGLLANPLNEMLSYDNRFLFQSLPSLDFDGNNKYHFQIAKVIITNELEIISHQDGQFRVMSLDFLWKQTLRGIWYCP